jgi:hypothetical protein
MPKHRVRFSEKDAACLLTPRFPPTNCPDSLARPTLAELCEVQPNKPLVYNEAIIDFGLKLLGRPDSWSFTYSPLDILTPIFQTEGHITESHNYSLTFKPHLVNVKAVLPLRNKVLDSIIGLLFNPDARIGVLAANALTDAFR